MYLTNATYISSILNFLIPVVRRFKFQISFHISSLHHLTHQVIKYVKNLKLHYIINLSNHHTINHIYFKIMKICIVCNSEHSIIFNVFFKQKLRILKTAQDLQSYKISFNVQKSVYFSAPTLSACAPRLRLLWQWRCLHSRKESLRCAGIQLHFKLL